MPFCPSCHYEYRFDVHTCPDCNVALVDRLPDTRQAVAVPVDNSWRPVCGVSAGMKAQMAKGALDSGNIPSTLVAGHTLSAGAYNLTLDLAHADWTGEPTLVMVPREFYEEAEVLLRGVLGSAFVEIEA